MKTQTEALKNFKIYDYDGNLVKTDYAAKKAAVIGSHAIDGLSAYSEQVAGAWHEMTDKIGKSLMAGMYDTLHGTDYREQLHGEWEQAQNEAFEESIGL